jgi:hypothetical protein
MELEIIMSNKARFRKTSIACFLSYAETRLRKKHMNTKQGIFGGSKKVTWRGRMAGEGEGENRIQLH